MTAPSGSPLVSVIMNCYNGSAYLREALDSVLAQTWPDWEIVFWDNGSTDDSAAIVKSIPDGRIRYFLAPNHTPLGAARNLAVAEAKGDWIAFLDCDDLWTPDKLARQVEIVLEERGRGRIPGFIYGRTNSFGPGMTEAPFQGFFAGRPLPEGELLDCLLENGDHIVLSSLMVYRPAFEKIGGIPPHLKYSEDYYLLAGIAASYPARAVQSLCCRYRMHSSNLSLKLSLENFEETILVVEAWMDKAKPAVRDFLRRDRLPKLYTYASLWYFRRGRWAEGRRRMKKAGTLFFLFRFLLKQLGLGFLNLFR